MDIFKHYRTVYFILLFIFVQRFVHATSTTANVSVNLTTANIAIPFDSDNDDGIAHLSMALKYAKAGNQAAQNNFWHKARENWQTAVHHIEKSDVADRNKAVFYYEYGHAAGITCDFEIADEYIEKSYRLDKAIGGPYFLSLVEMFRLHFDQKNYHIAAIYFKAALPKLQQINAEIKTPAKYSRLLDEYAIALKTTGKIYAAIEIKKDAQRVRQQAKILRYKFKRIIYGSRCEKKQQQFPVMVEQRQQVNFRIQKIRNILGEMNVR